MAGDAVTKMLTLVMRVQDDASAQLTRIQKVTKLFGGTVHKTTGQLQRFTHRFVQVARALVSFLIMRTVTVQFVKFFKELLRGNEILERATTSISRLVGSLGAAQKKIDYIRATAMRAPFDFESILQSSVLLTAFGKDIEKFLPRLLDWAAGMNMTSGELIGYASAMGKILAQSPHVLRLLQSRGIGLEQWKQALAEVNQELPQAQRFEEALFLVTERFEGQASALAKTLYGLKTNIHDVWVEMQREIGLSMFIKVRAALFGLYSDMRNLVDNQRDILYEIGDAIGSWVGNLIIFIKELPRLAGPLNAILKMVKYLAVFLIGRSLIAGLMSAVQWVTTLTTAFNMASLAAGAISIAVGLIVMQLVKAKMKAIELQQEFDQWRAYVELLADIASRQEKIFTRSERYLAGKQSAALLAEAARLREVRGGETFGWGWDEEELKRAESLLQLMGEDSALFGQPEDWITLQNLMAKMEEYREVWGTQGILPPDAHTEMMRFQSDLAGFAESLGLIGEARIVASDALVAASADDELVRKTEVAALAAINTALQMWKLNLAGVEGYESITLEHVRGIVEAQRENVLSLDGMIALLRIEKELSDHLLKTEEDRAKVMHDRFATLTATMDQQRAVAEAKHGLGGPGEDLLAVYQQQLDAVTQMMFMPGLSDDDVSALVLRMYDLLQVIQDLNYEMKDMNDATAFERYAAVVEQKIQMWQSALRPVSNALANMVLDVKNLGKYAAQAFKEMISWAIRLAFQYLILAILRMIWDPTASLKGAKGAMSSFGPGAWSGPMQGVKAADGFRGMINQPTIFLAGEEGPEYVDITPQGGGRRGGGGGITIMGDVYGFDDFVDKVQSANENIVLATGGEG